MGEIIGIVVGVAVAVGAFFLIFWGINKAIEIAPDYWALFLGIVGLLVGLVLGAFLNANVFGGGLGTVLGTAAAGAALGALFGWWRPPEIARRKSLSEAAQPWVFIGPALLLVTIGLIIPTIRTGILSFKDRSSENWIGFENFSWIFGNEDMFNMSGWKDIFTSRLFLVGLVALLLGLWFARRLGKSIGVRATYDGPVPLSWTALGVTFIAFAIFTSLEA